MLNKRNCYIKYEIFIFHFQDFDGNFFSFCLCLCINRQDFKRLYYKAKTVLYSMNVNKPVKQAAIETCIT